MAADHSVDSCFTVFEKELRNFQGKPGQYLHLVLGDCSGQIAARLWERGEEASQQLSPGSVVRVAGSVVRYQGELQVKITSLRSAGLEEYQLSDFLAPRPHPREEQLLALEKICTSIHDPHLRGLLEAFFGDPAFRDRFADAPAAQQIHHAYAGGLLDHSLGVVHLLEVVLRDHLGLDRDLLIVAALLHDMGKMEAYTFVGLTIQTTELGRLLDHLVLSDRMVMERLSTLPDFPPALAIRLTHILLSHHGLKENGSPVLPMSVEACALHYADNLDAQVQRFAEIVQRTPPGERWSTYQPGLGRSIFKGGD